VELYESGFNYFCYGRDLKVNMDMAVDFGCELGWRPLQTPHFYSIKPAGWFQNRLAYSQFVT
jgi:hypothetical protein